MKVVTLDSSQFTSTCRRLAADVLSQSFNPEMLVGIRTGGEYVAREMLPSFPEATLAIVELQRPSTAHKSMIGNLLPLLPVKLLDALRIVESRILSLLPSRPTPEVRLPADVVAQLPRRILVVDDAVDSGVTLSAIVNAIRTSRPDADVRSAVVTVTTSSPKINPDFALYRNHTLIRFPWSMDMKK